MRSPKPRENNIILGGAVAIEFRRRGWVSVCRREGASLVMAFSLCLVGGTSR